MTDTSVDRLPTIVSSRTLGGGSVADTRVADLADGRRVVIKRTAYDATLEAEGLEALRAAGAAVPGVLAVDRGTLVIEHVEGRTEWGRLGRTLAQVHRTTAAEHGWHRDNVIGPLPQSNPWTPNWPRFYAEHRVRPWLAASALPAGTRERLDAACDGPLLDLLRHDAPASLLHGDLWSGNVVDGTYLIDPAVHHGDRELDLAFADLFGGFPPAFWDAYAREWPLDDGWEQRRPALQLYHLLVHVELFGSGYAGRIERRLDQLGW